MLSASLGGRSRVIGKGSPGAWEQAGPKVGRKKICLTISK